MRFQQLTNAAYNLFAFMGLSHRMSQYALQYVCPPACLSVCFVHRIVCNSRLCHAIFTVSEVLLHVSQEKIERMSSSVYFLSESFVLAPVVQWD